MLKANVLSIYSKQAWLASKLNKPEVIALEHEL